MGAFVNAQVVADVGNSRIKWGVCAEQRITASASLPPVDPAAWEKQLSDWGLSGSLIWAIGSVNPGNFKVLTDWLQSRGDKVGFIARHNLLPLEIRVDSPERVGVDRLLNAVAANFNLRPSGKRKQARLGVIIDAGTAVTVDVVSPDGAFEGGAIFPGRRLMAAALHEYTALLPFVVGERSNPPPVGTNTSAAIETGIYYAVAGGVNELIFRHSLREGLTREPAVFLTGGDAGLMKDSIDNAALLWPEMTLEGLRLSAEAQP
jgi:type III pantothenate kinase